MENLYVICDSQKEETLTFFSYTKIKCNKKFKPNFGSSKERKEEKGRMKGDFKLIHYNEMYSTYSMAVSTWVEPTL